MRKPIITVLLLALAAVFVPPSNAAAQPESEANYASPMREQCEAELGRDHKWAASLQAKIRAVYKNEVRPDVHTEDAGLMLTNKKHVVMAYSALWLLVVGFVALLWVRQQKLVSEIARLERDVKKAVEEE
jgi:hypothetical protein